MKKIPTFILQTTIGRYKSCQNKEMDQEFTVQILVSEAETQPVTFLKRKKLFICLLLLNTGNNNDLNETCWVQTENKCIVGF